MRIATLVAGLLSLGVIIALHSPALAQDDADEQPRWESRASLGLTGSEGDTRTQSLTARLRTRWRDDMRRIEAQAHYFFGRSDSRTSQNEAQAMINHDWLMPDSPWFVFARAQYDYNNFRVWQQRAAAYAGLGYAFVDTDDLELLGRAGAGATYEFKGGRKWTPEALFGASVARWNITDNQTLTGSLTYYPNLENLDRYRLDANIEYTVTINTAEGLSLSVGAENQYESHPLDDGRRNNLTYYATLNLDF